MYAKLENVMHILGRKLIQGIHVFLLILNVVVLFAQKPRLQFQSYQSQEIKCIAVDPTGQYFASGSRDKTIFVWELKTGRLIHRLIGEFIITDITFSKNGKKIFAGDQNGGLKAWEVKTGKVIWTFLPSKNRTTITTLETSPDGNLLIAGTRGRYVKGREVAPVLHLIDEENGTLNKQVMLAKTVEDLWFDATSNQQIFILTSTKLSTLERYDIQTGRLSKIIDEKHSLADLLTRSKGYIGVDNRGGNLLLGKKRPTPTVYTLDYKKVKLKDSLALPEFPRGGFTLTVSPNGQYLASDVAFNKKTVQVWDLKSKKLIKTLVAQDPKIRGLAFSRDNQYLLGYTNSKSQKRPIAWLLETGKEITKMATYSTRTNAYAFHPSGSEVIMGSHNGGLGKWNLERGEVRAVKNSVSNIRGLTYNTKADKIAFITGGGNIYIQNNYERNDKKVELIGRHQDASVTNVHFSLDSKYLISSGFGIDIWNIAKKRLVHSHRTKGMGIKASEIIPLRNEIIFAKQVMEGRKSRKITLFRMSIANPASIKAVGQTGLSFVSDLTFNQKGDLLAVAGSSGKGIIQIWDFVNSRKISEISLGAYSAVIAFSPDGNSLLYTGNDGAMYRWNWEENTNELVFRKPGFQLRNIDVISKQGIIAVNNSMGGISFLEAESYKELIDLYPFESWDSWLLYHPEGYYWFSHPKKSVNQIHFTIDGNSYEFGQFDLKYHRPDLCLGQLKNVKKEIKKTQYGAYLKRLDKMNFTEEMLNLDTHSPEIELLDEEELPRNSTSKSIAIHINAADSLSTLDRLNVFVNDVPIYGIQGINLRDQNTQEYTTTLEIPLSRGENKIQVSALNQGGAESLKATTYITYDAPEVKPDLHLITIGVSDYQAEGKDLQYAAKDAQDIADFYSDATSFNQIHTSTLTDAQVTKSNILALRNKLEQTSVDDQVLIYVSGHGLLDDNYDFYYGTHDIDFSNPGEKGILYDDIEGLLDGIPARKKLLLMDACHSGEYDVDTTPMTQAQQDSLAAKGITFKGFAKGRGESTPILGLQNSFEMMKQLFADLRRGSGATVISSSSGLQFSYEDTEWENGAFTYVLLNGLKTMNADANGDGEITASEIQAYVGEFVPKLTEGLQVPTFRQENLAYDFRVW